MLPLALFLFAVSGIAQEQFEVTKFVGYTHRGFFEQPALEDYTRGFPRVEFEVRRTSPALWLSAKLRVSVDGIVTKKNFRIPSTTLTKAYFRSLTKTFALSQPIA